MSRTLLSVWNEEGGRTSLSMTAGGGYYAGYGYDGLGRMIRVTEPGDYPVTTFTYRPDGRRGSMAQGPGVATSSSSWDYDEAGRLRSITHDLAGTTSDQALTFTYNPAAQMVSRTSDNPLYKWTAPYVVERNYQVNGLNQYQSTTGTKAATFAYDLNGNLTQAASVDPADGTTNLVYDVENRLVSASGARTAQLTYDPLGRLWKVQGSTGARTFLHDGDAIIAEFDASGAMTDAYVHGNGDDDPLIWHHLADGPSLARKFLKANHQGSIIAIAGNDGAATAINSYDPWGVPGAANQGLFQYTGQVWLPELGMYYYKARIYWAALGRFLQTDPVGYKDQMDLYTYVGDDPLNNLDPTGNDAVVVVHANNDVEITVPILFEGDAASPANIAQVSASVASTYSGQFGKYHVTTRVVQLTSQQAKNSEVVNTMEISADPLLRGSNGGHSYIGPAGNEAHLSMMDQNSQRMPHGMFTTDAPHGQGTGAHEVGHLMGLPDSHNKGQGIMDEGKGNGVSEKDIQLIIQPNHPDMGTHNMVTRCPSLDCPGG